MNQTELKHISEIDKNELLNYWKEFIDYGEKENVLWELSRMDIDDYYLVNCQDERNKRYGLLSEGRLVGMLRISSRINYHANGMIGYSIRPSERGNGFGSIIIKHAIDVCKRDGIIPVTACVDTRNAVSIHILEKSGFERTGMVYDWIPDNGPRKAYEFVYM